jgi:hypothetical protein
VYAVALFDGYTLAAYWAYAVLLLIQELQFLSSIDFSAHAYGVAFFEIGFPFGVEWSCF